MLYKNKINAAKPQIKMAADYVKNKKIDYSAIMNFQEKKMCCVSARRLSIHKTYNTF
jgi:hypothetical protein